MLREILIVHPSKLVRRIASNFALAELPDVVMDAAASSLQGLERLKSRKYHAVVSAMEMADLTGLELFEEMTREGYNRETPFIVITATRTDEQKERLRRAGIEHILFPPYTSEALARLIDRAVPPRSLRRHARVSSPGARARVYSDLGDIDMNLINISRNGLLGEINHRDETPVPWKPSSLDLYFPDGKKELRADNILAAACRLEVVSWRTDNHPDVFRTAWKFLDVPWSAQKCLATVLEKINREQALPDEAPSPSS